MENDIIKTLKDGKLVIMPTDTIYGIIGDATNEDVINKVYEVKERPHDKPLLILVSNFSMLHELVTEIPKETEKIIKKFWPGPLTILFKKSSKVSDTLTANSSLVAIRMPNDKRLLNIMNRLNRPLISTSANISSHNAITNPNQLEEKMKEKIDLIVDEGTVNNEASTLITIVNGKIEILREGSLTEKIRKLQ